MFQKNYKSTMADDWSEEPQDAPIEEAPATVMAELPEIKLFGKWSCEDVSVSDMSLQVTLLLFLNRS